MTNVLLITAIGMGLVFVVIILLWGMMELLVRLLADKSAKEETEAAPSLVEAEPVEPEPQVAGTHRQKAAAVAVTAALQIRRRQAAVEAVRLALASVNQPMLNPAEAGQASNWQAVMRAVQRQNQTKFFTRTPRNVR